jgi:hypothetical protein
MKQLIIVLAMFSIAWTITPDFPEVQNVYGVHLTAGAELEEFVLVESITFPYTISFQCITDDGDLFVVSSITIDNLESFPKRDVCTPQWRFDKCKFKVTGKACLIKWGDE